MISQKLKNELIEKATKDDVFQQLLINDPKAAIKQHSGRTVEDIEIVVIEESSQKFVIVIPANKEALSEDDLDKVAAGGCAEMWENR